MMRSALVLFMSLLTFSAVSAQEFDATFLTRPGDIMPAFTVTTSDGQTINTNDLKGRVILINFFATWCPPCNKELPHLEKEIWAKYKDNKNFALLVIGREHKLEEIKKFKQEKLLTLPMGADPDRSIYKQFATQTIPRNYLIGKDGRIIYQSQGFSDDEMTRILDLIEKNL
jgi:peroxiredoxin